MSLLPQYVEYLKDNPKRYWFRRRLYGFGWTPATWQGWLSSLVLILVMIWIIVSFAHMQKPTSAESMWFLIKFAIWVCALVLLCYLTGEPPKWQWGVPKEPEN